VSGYATFADACPACVTLWTVALMHRMRCYRHWVADSFSTFQPLKTVPRPWGFFFTNSNTYTRTSLINNVSKLVYDVYYYYMSNVLLFIYPRCIKLLFVAGLCTYRLRELTDPLAAFSKCRSCCHSQLFRLPAKGHDFHHHHFIGQEVQAKQHIHSEQYWQDNKAAYCTNSCPSKSLKTAI